MNRTDALRLFPGAFIDTNDRTRIGIKDGSDVWWLRLAGVEKESDPAPVLAREARRQGVAAIAKPPVRDIAAPEYEAPTFEVPALDSQPLPGDSGAESTCAVFDMEKAEDKKTLGADDWPEMPWLDNATGTAGKHEGREW